MLYQGLCPSLPKRGDKGVSSTPRYSHSFHCRQETCCAKSSHNCIFGRMRTIPNSSPAPSLGKRRGACFVHKPLLRFFRRGDRGVSSSPRCSHGFHCRQETCCAKSSHHCIFGRMRTIPNSSPAPSLGMGSLFCPQVASPLFLREGIEG